MVQGGLIATDHDDTTGTHADQDPSLKADWTRPEWRPAVGRDAPTAGRP